MPTKTIITAMNTVAAILASCTWAATAGAQSASRPPIIRATDVLGSNPFSRPRSNSRPVAAVTPMPEGAGARQDESVQVFERRLSRCGTVGSHRL